jgi:uncharacterized protein YceK
MKCIAIFICILLGGCSTLNLTADERRNIMEEEILRERAGDNLIQMSQSLEAGLINSCR